MATNDGLGSLKKPKNGLAIISLALGIILCLPDPQDGWLATFAVPLLEAGLLYIIYRFLFIEEAEHGKIKKLTKEVEALRKDNAIGLADSYYYNYASKISDTMRHYLDD